MVVPLAYEIGINKQMPISPVSGEEVRVIQLDIFFFEIVMIRQLLQQIRQLNPRSLRIL